MSEFWSSIGAYLLQKYYHDVPPNYANQRFESFASKIASLSDYPRYLSAEEREIYSGIMPQEPYERVQLLTKLTKSQRGEWMSIVNSLKLLDVLNSLDMVKEAFDIQVSEEELTTNNYSRLEINVIRAKLFKLWEKALDDPYNEKLLEFNKKFSGIIDSISIKSSPYTKHE